MFFYISKTFQYFIFPLTLLFLALILIFFIYPHRTAKYLLGGLILLFYILTIPLTGNLLMAYLEEPPSSNEIYLQTFDVVIVLTGMLNQDLSTVERLEFHEGVDRILAGISLVKNGVAQHLLISGGTGKVFNQSKREAKLLKNFSVKFGVSPEQILIDGISRNTYENALNSTTIIQEYGFTKYLLVTSSFHMRRARGAFNKQGIFPEVYPVDFRTPGQIEIDFFQFLPSVGGLSMVTGAIREFIALAAYKVKGYI